MSVITAVAQKGGPGKSTLCGHLLGALGLMGRRVLAIDCDPQGTLTKAFLGAEAAQIHPSQTIASIFAGRDPLPSDVIIPSGIAGVDLIPASKAADSFNLPDPHLASRDVQALMRNFVDEAKRPYALTIIDTAPNLYALCFGALTASDYCIVPCKPEKKNTEALATVLEVISQVQEGPNPSLVNLGIIFSQVSRTAAHSASLQLARRELGDLIFENIIPVLTLLNEADMDLKPVTHFKPRSVPAKVFKAVADEVLARIAAVDSPAITEAVAHV